VAAVPSGLSLTPPQETELNWMQRMDVCSSEMLVDFSGFSLRYIPEESTQPLTEMSTRNVPGDKGRPARKVDKLTANCEPTVLTKMWEPRRLRTLWASTACYTDGFTFLHPRRRNYLSGK
jgi:hypothetical protein